MKKVSSTLALLCVVVPTFGCENCLGEHVRNVRRMQPGAQNATVAPRGPLAWGQLNFLHTTDTHGWLEGYGLLKNSNTWTSLTQLQPYQRAELWRGLGRFRQLYEAYEAQGWQPGG